MYALDLYHELLNVRTCTSQKVHVCVSPTRAGDSEELVGILHCMVVRDCPR